MKIIKIKEDHFIIVDDSEIKVNDWYYLPRTNSAYECKEDPTELNLERSFGVAKITHSTQPIESLTIPGTYNGPVWNKIKEIPLSEVKELIGEVDVEKKAESYAKDGLVLDTPYANGLFYGYIKGYTQALEDNKGKKYTEEDVISIVKKSRETGLTAEYLLLSLQPKTEWEVEIIDGKLKLV